MAYVAPQNKISMLSNALSGTAKAMNDFAAVKLERDKMAQQQAQFDANLDLGFQRLDEQIRKADMDDATRREMQKLRNDLAKSEGMATRATQERIATQRTGLGYSQLAESKRQFNYEAEQEARQESSIAQYVTTFDDIPDLLSPEENPEEFAEKYPGGIQDPLYASDWQQRERMITEQGNALALQMSPSGNVTAEIRKQARSIVEDKKGFSARVVNRQEEMSKAKYAGYNIRTSGNRARDYLSKTAGMPGSKSSAESAAEWRPVYKKAPFYKAGIGPMEGQITAEPEDIRDREGNLIPQSAEGWVVKPLDQANHIAISNAITNIPDYERQQAAARSFNAFKAMMNHGNTELKHLRDTKGRNEIRTKMIAAGEQLDLYMGNTRMQARGLAQRHYQYYSENQLRDPSLKLAWQEGRNVPTLTHRPPTRVEIQNQAIGSSADSTTMPDENQDHLLDQFPDGMSVTKYMDDMSVENPQKHSDVEAAIVEAYFAKGGSLTPEEHRQVIRDFNLRARGGNPPNLWGN